MQIRVLLFAILRDEAGTNQLTIKLPDGATLADAVDHIGRQLPTIRFRLKSGKCAFAVNQNYSNMGIPLKDGDELALIPPVSGG